MLLSMTNNRAGATTERLRTVWGVFVALLISVAVFVPLDLRAKDYKTAYSLYVSGDYSGAEHAFRQAFVASKDNSQRGQILKLLGVSQYMQGKRLEAEASFKKAKSFDPGLEIRSSEVLDETVIDFFRQVKAPSQAPRPKLAKPSPKLPPTAGSPASPKLTPAPVPAVRQVEAQTYLQVSTNVAAYKLKVDGKLVKRPRGLLQVSPGHHIIEVSAKGYVSRVLRVMLKKGQINEAQVKLSEKKLSGRGGRKSGKKVSKRKIRSKSSSSKARDTKSSKSIKQQTSVGNRASTLFYLLPFGSGQFVNDDWALGILLGGTQVLSFGYYLLKYQEEVALANDTNQVIDERTAYESTLTDSDEVDAYHAETEEFHAARTQNLDALRTQGLIALSVSLAAWGVSIIEGFASAPSSTKLVTRPSRLDGGVELRVVDQLSEHAHAGVFFLPASARVGLDLSWEF